MNRFIAGFAFLAVAGAALAQNTPVGKWHSIDDKTKEIKSEITITEAGGVLTGKVSKILRKDAKPDAKCDECTDARKGQPMMGLEIIRGIKKEDGADVWSGGKILDPENGKEYTLKLTPEDGGKKLAVRGSIGPFGRTQTWVRVQ
ncbi:MAG: DUF2147 domain-containing protein [Brachymonas sp.]|nr:DUF2147 domain-containing protein [Brachymonas sp.]